MAGPSHWRRAPVDAAATRLMIQKPGGARTLTTTRLMNSRSDLIAALAQGAPAAGIFQQIAVKIERSAAGAHCGFHLGDGSGRLAPFAAGGLPAGFVNLCAAGDPPPDAEWTGVAAISRQPVIISDLAAGPHSAGRRAALDHALRACWAQPFFGASGDLLGVLTLYFTEARAPSAREREAVERMLPIAIIAAEQRRAELALRSGEERFATLAATIPGVVYQRVVSADGTIRYTYISEGANELFGVSPKRIVEDPEVLFSTYAPEYRAQFRERLLAASRDLTMWDVQASIVTPTGQQKFTHAIARPRRQADGSVVWNGIILDATRMKQAEIAAAQARDEAQAANRTKSEFLANMSHELRTPLNAIIGFSELMRTGKFGPLNNARYEEYSGIIHDSGNHLLAIINDILDLSKVEAGGMTLREEDVSLAEVCASCERLITGRAQDGNVSVTFAPLADSPVLLADKVKVKQMLLNLLSNAIKFSQPGAKVDVRFAPGGDGGIDLSVADTGIGIAKENLPVVMRPFRQVENVFSRTHEGTGLGLPLVKALIELHGGTLTIDSELGQGTVVTLHFPPARVQRMGTLVSHSGGAALNSKLGGRA